MSRDRAAPAYAAFRSRPRQVIDEIRPIAAQRNQDHTWFIRLPKLATPSFTRCESRLQRLCGVGQCGHLVPHPQVHADVGKKLRRGLGDDFFRPSYQGQ